MPKFVGFFWPPREYFTDKPWGKWYLNRPLAHFVGGVLLEPIMLILWPAAIVQRLLAVGLIMVLREEKQLEDWSEHGGSPFYRTVFDTVFALIGALLIELVVWFFRRG